MNRPLTNKALGISSLKDDVIAVHSTIDTSLDLTIHQPTNAEDGDLERPNSKLLSKNNFKDMRSSIN
jgi:hypothetical protein